MKTFVTKQNDIIRKWYVVDAENKVLGRLAVEVANLLRGKNKTYFQPNIDTGDYVIILNAEKISLTGLKTEQKTYFTARPTIGHSSNASFKDMSEKHPERIVEKAIKGMIPHNALGRDIYRKLRVYKGSKHDHQAQNPEAFDF